MAREYRINQQIRARQVMVVDENGEQIGVLPVEEAMRQAREKDLDLVEVAPNAVPPVCRLLDYGRFRYMQTKKQRESRKGSHTGTMREVRFRPRIGEHDVEAKSRLILKLLAEGSKVKVSVMFRGREMTHPEIGANILRRIAENLSEEAKLEKAPSMEGRFLSIILTPIVKEGAARPAREERSQDSPAGDRQVSEG